MAFRTRPCTTALRALTGRAHTPLRGLSTTKPAPTPSQKLHNRGILQILDRTILSPERAETSCSGTDNAVAADVFAYDPTVTAPESEFKCFEEEVRLDGEVDPLFISPANRDFSQTLDRDLDGRAIVRDKEDRLGGAGSSRGWVKKGKPVKVKVKTKGGKMKTTVKGDSGDEFERLLRGLRRLQMRYVSPFDGCW